jgi:hypothetical protein
LEHFLRGTIPGQGIRKTKPGLLYRSSLFVERLFCRCFEKANQVAEESIAVWQKTLFKSSFLSCKPDNSNPSPDLAD